MRDPGSLWHVTLVTGALSLAVYEPEYWSSENGNFIDCTQGRTDPDPEKVCEFKLDFIIPCVLEDGYGWGDGQPCIILKLNKVLR